MSSQKNLGITLVVLAVIIFSILQFAYFGSSFVRITANNQAEVVRLVVLIINLINIVVAISGIYLIVKNKNIDSVVRPGTIASLNAKKWYWILKTVFIMVYVYGLFVVAIIILRGVVVSRPQQVFDSQNSYIVCDNGTKILLPDAHTQLDEYDGVGILADYDFRKLCLAEAESKHIGEIYAEKTKDFDLSISDYSNELSQVRWGLLSQMPKNYEYTKVEKISRTWLSLIINLLIIAFIFPIIMEIIRRIFYLIVLKTPFPKKK